VIFSETGILHHMDDLFVIKNDGRSEIPRGGTLMKPDVYVAERGRRFLPDQVYLYSRS
jgi:hypothetical protein